MLSKLKIKCRNQDNGCLSVIEYEKLEVHEEVECEYQEYFCPQKSLGCLIKMMRTDISRHLV